MMILFSSMSFACNIDEEIARLKNANTDFEKEDILYDMNSSLIFCGTEAYSKVAMAVYENSNLGDYFIPSLLYQFKELAGYSFQIGEEWNRKALSVFVWKGNDKHLLRIGTATGVYLGEYNKRGLIATNRHVLNRENCSDLIINNTNGEKLDCLEIIRPESHLDYAFILTNTVLKQDPLEFEWDRNDKFTPLLTAGRGYQYNEEQRFLEESSELCQIFDEDDLGQSMGCDSSPGDSGSPVFLKQENKLYGLANSTGNHILSFSNSDYKKLLSNDVFKGLIDLQSSHLVPLYMIKKDLQNAGVTKTAKDIISCMMTRGCLK
jgi:hypothetical protein